MLGSLVPQALNFNKAGALGSFLRHIFGSKGSIRPQYSSPAPWQRAHVHRATVETPRAPFTLSIGKSYSAATVCWTSLNYTLHRLP